MRTGSTSWWAGLEQYLRRRQPFLLALSVQFLFNLLKAKRTLEADAGRAAELANAWWDAWPHPATALGETRRH